ncbi:MAG TPA: sialidase family protein [Pyrinomonadaceae bacterium]
MKIQLAFFFLVLFVCDPLTLSAQQPRRVNTNIPIVTVVKEVYMKHPGRGVGISVSPRYVGPNRELEEIAFDGLKDDTPVGVRRRRSPDNGRTWSQWEPLPPMVLNENGTRVDWWMGGGNGAGASNFYDPVAKVSVSIWLRQTGYDPTGSSLKPIHNQLFYRISHDYERTWGEPKQFLYEDGAPFDSKDPFNEGFLLRNEAYPGNNTIRHSNGTYIHCAANATDPNDPERQQRQMQIGSICFVGKWDGNKKDYIWTSGNRISISPKLSPRGLLEPAVAELKDRRLFVIWRGSSARLDPLKVPGRKWYSLSADGGITLSPVRELKYDDGSSFYSPSSYHRLLRHSQTGKLYWIGNIVSDPPKGSNPRYPLVIAEVNEELPALKRKTVTVIDDRQPGEDEGLELSNFEILENRQSHEIEIYLSRYGEDPHDFWAADAYRYKLRLTESDPARQ